MKKNVRAVEVVGPHAVESPVAHVGRDDALLAARGGAHARTPLLDEQQEVPAGALGLGTRVGGQAAHHHQHRHQRHRESDDLHVSCSDRRRPKKNKSKNKQKKG